MKATASPAWSGPPAFLVTVDTEGDDAWSRPRETHTRNAAYAERFQHLCEDAGLRPTWLVNHEMALCPVFSAFGRQVVRQGRGEVGMHLHAWNSPPHIELTGDDLRHQPFLVEYPLQWMQRKVDRITSLLRERFECEITSHRAGRWALDSAYARLLVDHGYRVDCSVTPHVSWAASRGAPDGRGGADYRAFPDQPYRVDLQRIDRPGDSPLLEVPVTIRPSALQRIAPWSYALPGLRRWAWRQAPPQRWLYPDGRNLPHLRAVLDEALAAGQPCVQMVLHSPDLMPGGSPNSPDAPAVEALYRDLGELLHEASRRFVGMTLAEFGARWTKGLA